MKLGVPWTSKGKKSPERSAPNEDADAASVHGRLDDLTRQLERLSRITAGKVRPPGSAADARARDQPPPDEEDDPNGRVDRHQEQFAAEVRGASGGGEIARYAGDRTLNRNPLRPVYSDSGLDQGNRNPALRLAYSDSNLDQAMAEIAARQRALDGESRPPSTARRGPDVIRPMVPPSQNLSGLEEQLSKITAQIESLRRPSAVDDAVPALRQELSDISRSLADAMPRHAIEAIEAEVRGLAQRLDQSRQSGIDGSSLANLEHGLAEVRDALHSLKPAESLVGFQAAIQGLGRKIDTVVASQQDPVVLQQLESAITGLRGIVAHVASDDTLARLTEEVRGIGARIERTAGAAAAPDALTNLERQIGAIAGAIDESNAQGRQVPAQLESMVRGLADKLEKLQPSRGDTIAFGQLEDRIAKLVEKLDASGSRFNHLEAIERGLADVLVHLEEQRTRGGGALRAAGSDPAMESLKRDLDSVNGTLNRVVERLATIETGIRGGARSAAPAAAPAAIPAAAPATLPAAATLPPTAKPAPVPAASPPPAPPPAEVVPLKAPVLPATVGAANAVSVKQVASPSERLAAAAQVQRPAAPRERPPIDPNLPPDHPLEPGAARARATQSPADRIAASEAALGPAKPPAAADPGGKSNFIAAARRAAQAALRLPIESNSGKGANEPPDAAPKGSLRQRLSGRIRSILVGASVVILAAAALRVAMTLMEPGADGPDTKKAATAPAILPAPKSPGRILPSAPFVGTMPQGGPQGGLAPAPGAGAAPAGETPPAPGNGEPPAAGAAPQSAPAPDKRSDITGSIPSRTVTPGQPAAVPMPPSRPGSEGPAGPVSRLVTAAKAGDPAAAYELAGRHIDAHSYEEAAQWLTRASKQGLAPAQFRLGSLYEKGLGVKKDLNEARRLYSAAAAKGNAKAMHNLAVLYAEGIDGRPDYKTAVPWFRKAADRGVADSQYNLAVLYARGVGLEQNLAESYKWFALAANQGDQESGRKRDDIAARLDAESLMAARLAVKTWTMEPQPEEATTVKAPPGGWDQALPQTSSKRRPRSAAPMKIGPG